MLCCFRPQHASLATLCPLRHDASRGFPAVGALRVFSATTAAPGPTGRVDILQYNLDFSNPDCSNFRFVRSNALLTRLGPEISLLRGGADKSLARRTSPCRRTESVVSVHVPNCKSLLITEAERKHVRRSARFQQHRDASCHQVFFSARQGIEGNLCHSDRNIGGTCTVVCHRRKVCKKCIELHGEYSE